MGSAIDQILESRKAGKPEGTGEVEADKFYSILVGDVSQENFLELQFARGARSCFPYTDVQWFTYDPESGCIDIEIGGFMIVLKGRGLGGKIFQGLKQKRLSWVKEADSAMQDHKDNEVFIEEITVTPPGGFWEEEGADS